VTILPLDPAGNEIGKHKVMSLRNIAITPPYGHNGAFKNLEQIVHFYNTRDTLGPARDNNDIKFAKKGWPEPEVPTNINDSELGDLGLTEDEEKALVVFLKTLTDDYPLWGHDPLIPPGTSSPYDLNPGR
jgi:cytochrome c peroxidase